MFTPEGVPGEGSLDRPRRRSDAQAARWHRRYQAGFTWLRRPEFVSVAAVRGHAIGAGFQLALPATSGSPPTTRSSRWRSRRSGWCPDLGGTQPLVEAVGYARGARDLRDRPPGRRRGGGAGRPGQPRGRRSTSSTPRRRTWSPRCCRTNRDAVTAHQAAAARCPRPRSYDDQLRAEREAQVQRLRSCWRSTPKPA